MVASAEWTYFLAKDLNTGSLSWNSDGWNWNFYTSSRFWSFNFCNLICPRRKVIGLWSQQTPVTFKHKNCQYAMILAKPRHPIPSYSSSPLYNWFECFMQCIFRFLAFNMLVCRSMCFCRGKTCFAHSIYPYSTASPKINSYAWKQVRILMVSYNDNRT